MLHSTAVTWAKPLAGMYTQTSGIRLFIDSVPITQINDRILDLLKDGNGSAQASLYNGYMYEAGYAIQDLDDAGAFLDLSE